MFKAKIENIPKSSLEPIYNELYDKRINVSVSCSDRNLQKYTIVVPIKQLTVATLIVSKYV